MLGGNTPPYGKVKLSKSVGWLIFQRKDRVRDARGSKEKGENCQNVYKDAQQAFCSADSGDMYVARCHAEQSPINADV